jgi:hypothetical protein
MPRSTSDSDGSSASPLLDAAGGSVAAAATRGALGAFFADDAAARARLMYEGDENSALEAVLA